MLESQYFLNSGAYELALFTLATFLLPEILQIKEVSKII